MGENMKVLGGWARCMDLGFTNGPMGKGMKGSIFVIRDLVMEL